jgi:hypothetical protein
MVIVHVELLGTLFQATINVHLHPFFKLLDVVVHIGFQNLIEFIYIWSVGSELIEKSVKFLPKIRIRLDLNFGCPPNF